MQPARGPVPVGVDAAEASTLSAPAAATGDGPAAEPLDFLNAPVPPTEPVETPVEGGGGVHGEEAAAAAAAARDSRQRLQV